MSVLTIFKKCITAQASGVCKLHNFELPRLLQLLKSSSTVSYVVEKLSLTKSTI